MRNFAIKATIGIAFSFALFISCRHEILLPSPVSDCTNTSISVSATITNATSSTSANGIIVAAANGGSDFQYKINSGSYQSSGTFSGLAAGTYIITAKSSTGCVGTAQFALSADNICSSKTISLEATATNSEECTSTGSITVSASGSSGFSYQVNGGAFQSSNIFSNLPKGSYTVTVKDIDNCTKTTSTTIAGETAGPLFTNVKALVITQCKPCHINGGNTGGVNFDRDCDIVAKKDRIKARAVDANPSPMPPNGPLTDAQKKTITDWMNAGGKFSN